MHMHTFHVISRELGSNVCFNLIHNDSIPETSVQYACRAAFALLTSPLMLYCIILLYERGMDVCVIVWTYISDYVLGR